MASTGLGSPPKALFRLSAYLAFTAAMIPIQCGLLALRLPARAAFPRWYHRQCCRIMGFRVERRGRQSRIHPTLFVANHSSYLDIMVLGSLVAGSFVAKSEVAQWFLYGLLAKLQRSVFVERRAVKAAAHRDAITERLEDGDDLILFPEGTSDDGNRVLPFKSALFSVAERRPEGRPLTVQPVSIAYTRLDGLPMGRYLRPFYTWYGDMEMAPHMWNLAGLGRLTVVVRFHPPVTVDDFGSRKALSDHCQTAVSHGMARALSGRPQSAEAQKAAAA